MLLSMGWPNGTPASVSATGSNSWEVFTIVVSVGPHWHRIRSCGPKISSARSAVARRSSSPAVMITRMVLWRIPDWLISSRWEGVIANAVTPPSSMTCRSVTALTSRTGSIVPPASSGRKTAHPAMSKEIEATSGILADASMPASRLTQRT